MNRIRWVALCAVTLICAYLSWAALPPRRPLLPAHGLSPHLRLAALAHAPGRLCSRLENTALIDGFFHFDPVQADAERSSEARNAGLPALQPPFTAPMEQRLQVDLALAWLRPAAVAAVIVDIGGARETWVGVQGGRCGVAGRLAAWFVPHLYSGDSVWLRVSRKDLPPPPSLTNSAAATGASASSAPAPIDWPRKTTADVAVLLPEGPGGLSQSGPGASAEWQAPADAFCRAAGLPPGIERIECALWVEPDRLRWEGRYVGHFATPASSTTAVPSRVTPFNPPAIAQLPAPSAADIFLTLHCDLDWPRLYHDLVDGMNESQRADFLRSMRYYRLAQKGYSQPEDDLIDPLGCGFAIVGRRGAEYAGNRLMPSVQAEIPLRPPAASLLPLPLESPNQKFRAMMPDFAEARFDKIRRVGESSYAVHPSYVAVTTGAAFDRYVLVRPSIAGSALIPAWQVDTTRIKIGTRPDVLLQPDLFRLEPDAPKPTRAGPAFALYFDPAGITEQLDKFRILIMVEAGADRPMPDEGVSAERIEIENEFVAKRTNANMLVAAQVGWLLQRLGPLTLEFTPAPEDDDAKPSKIIRNEPPSAEFRGSLVLKERR